MALERLKKSMWDTPRAISEFGIGFGANIGHIALNEVRDKLNPYPTSLTATLMDKIETLLIADQTQVLSGGQRQVEALKAVHIANELQVAASGIRAAQQDIERAAKVGKKPEKARTRSDIQVVERSQVADEFKRNFVRFAGIVVVKGITIPETEEFPYRTTDEDVDGFIDVADLAYQGVKAQETIDPPLRPVGYEPPVFDTLHIATQKRFHPGTTILI